jgi:hypothetical protein
MSVFVVVFDSLECTRKIMPSQKSFAQQSRVQNIVCSKFAAHNALGDCRYLLRLMFHIQKDMDEVLLSCNFNVNSVFQVLTQKPFGLKNLRTLQPLLDGKYVSENMRRKLTSGLTLHRVKL